MPGISPKLPLSFAPSEGYTLVKTIPEIVRQNLINLLLTNPGERMMDPAFGVGVKKFLFEQNIDSTYVLLKSIISKQVQKYMPFININNILINRDLDDENIMYIKISYLISPLNQTDSLSTQVRR